MCIDIVGDGTGAGTGAAVRAAVTAAEAECSVRHAPYMCACVQHDACPGRSAIPAYDSIRSNSPPADHTIRVPGYS